MKRWHEKLDPRGLKLLKSYRKLNKLYDVEEFRRWENRGDWESTELHDRLVPSKVKLTIHLLDLVSEMPPRWRRNRWKLNHYPAPGAICPVIEDTSLYYIAKLLKRLQFGSRFLDREEKKIVAAQCFELCARVC